MELVIAFVVIGIFVVLGLGILVGRAIALDHDAHDETSERLGQDGWPRRDR